MLASALMIALASCADPFAPGELTELHLRLTRAQWDQLRAAKPLGTSCQQAYPFIEVGFRCGPTGDWQQIGARHKRGDQRGVDVEQKPPLKLDFDWAVPGQRLLGVDKLSLNNGQSNLAGGVLPDLLAEAVAWRLLQRELPRVSRTGYARLYVHFSDEGDAAEYHGLYLAIEDLDRQAMGHRFASTCGALLKSTTVWCRDEVVYDDGPPNAARDLYDRWYDVSGFDHSNWPARTEAALDLDGLFTQQAILDALGDGWDTQVGPTYNNGYRFEPRGSVASFYPWDLDQAFHAYPQGEAATQPLEPDCSPLGNKTRCEPSLRDRYLRKVCELTQGPLSVPRLLDLWDSTDQLVRPNLAEERDALWSGRDPLDTTVQGSYQAEYERLRAWIPDRIAAVRAEVASKGIPCAETCEEGSTQTCTQSDCAGQKTCVGGAWTPCSVRPAAEVCNGLDDDCNGLVDEGCPDPGETCAQASPAPRRQISQCGCTSTPGLGAAAAIAWLLRRRAKVSRA